ncbi:MAG: hypothetical protein HOQ21_09955 [Dermatophilaceae bacterium]|nr:hypothetical protein [Dermatophilaceae bacterium]
MNKTTSRLASGAIANRYWVVPTQGPRLTEQHELLGPYRGKRSAAGTRDKYLAQGIACEVVDSDERPVIEKPAHPDQAHADAMAAGLMQLATFVRTHPEFHRDLRYSAIGRINAPLSGARETADHLATWARAAKAAKANVTKNATDDFFGIQVTFGPIAVHVYAPREEVCERVVVGTREVTEEVPDPELLAAVPTTTVTRTEEIVEWECRPLLAAEAVQP